MASSLKEVKEYIASNPNEVKSALDLENVANIAVSTFGSVEDNIQANILSFKKRAITIDGVTVNIVTID